MNSMQEAAGAAQTAPPGTPAAAMQGRNGFGGPICNGEPAPAATATLVKAGTHKILNQAMYDVTQALDMKNVRLASFH